MLLSPSTAVISRPTKGIKSENVQDLAKTAVENRYGRINILPKPIEWLTDNGSCFIVRTLDQQHKLKGVTTRVKHSFSGLNNCDARVGATSAPNGCARHRPVRAGRFCLLDQGVSGTRPSFLAGRLTQPPLLGQRL